MSGESQRSANSTFCSSHQGTRAGVWGSPTCHNGSPKWLRNQLAGPGPGPGWGGRSWTLGASGCPGGAGAGCPPAGDGAGIPLLAAHGWPGWGRGVGQEKEQMHSEHSCSRRQSAAWMSGLCPVPAGTVQLCCKWILELPRVSAFLATYRDTPLSSCPSLHIW